MLGGGGVDAPAGTAPTDSAVDSSSACTALFTYAKRIGALLVVCPARTTPRGAVCSRTALTKVGGRENRGAVTQESGGGAREWCRPAASAAGGAACERGASRVPRASWTLKTTGRPVARGALRKRCSAQSAGWMRTQTAVEWASMCG